MSKKIYIVTAGYDEAYGICAVFDKRKLAEEFLKRNQEEENIRIEEWELNPKL